jgi:hypothetical protein
MYLGYAMIAVYIMYTAWDLGGTEWMFLLTLALFSSYLHHLTIHGAGDGGGGGAGNSAHMQSYSPTILPAIYRC